MDGKTATANFGEAVPVPRTVIAPITQGGLNIQPQTRFQYKNIGVNIGITPRTHANDEITLTLNIELSTMAGTGFEGLPKFGARTVNTSIRLKDGQTNILAGLIRDDERVIKEGAIPALGSLFGRNRKEANQTDVVIMLTPHIVARARHQRRRPAPIPCPARRIRRRARRSRSGRAAAADYSGGRGRGGAKVIKAEGARHKAEVRSELSRVIHSLNLRPRATDRRQLKAEGIRQKAEVRNLPSTRQPIHFPRRGAVS